MICKLKHETEDKYTKRETAKVQGSVFTQNKVLGFWKWQNEQMKKWAVTKFYAKKKKKKKKGYTLGTISCHFWQIIYT